MEKTCLMVLSVITSCYCNFDILCSIHFLGSNVISVDLSIVERTFIRNHFVLLNYNFLDINIII